MSAPPIDPVDNLAHLALFISHDVGLAISAAFVTQLAELWFIQFSDEDRRRLFRSHPANNIVFSALSALEDRAIVRIYETVHDEHGLHRNTAQIRRKEDLELHRLALSHPATVGWHKKRMQIFADADRAGYDWRPALVWDLQRSINDELKRNKREVYNETITVSYDMAAALHTILDLSRCPECEIPSRDKLFEYMQREAPKYQALLEAHPDGGRDTEAERARAEAQRTRFAKYTRTQ
jgi:hypothetical protein